MSDNKNLDNNNNDVDKFNIILTKLAELNSKIEKLENKIVPNYDFVSPDNKKKYDIILKVINAVLSNNGKENIKNLSDLKKVERDCFINDNNNKIIDENEKEILEAFDKKSINWYAKLRTKCYLLTFIKLGCSDIGYDFISKDTTHKNEEDGKYYRCTIYDIIKIKV